jgi:hypothetical protein
MLMLDRYEVPGTPNDPPSAGRRVSLLVAWLTRPNGPEARSSNPFGISFTRPGAATVTGARTLVGADLVLGLEPGVNLHVYG